MRTYPLSLCSIPVVRSVVVATNTFIRGVGLTSWVVVMARVKMSASVCVVLLCLLLAAAHCSPLPRAQPKGFGTAKYALVIGCDGLGGLKERGHV